MSVAKVSLTLDEEVVTSAREVAGPRGLSSYVNRALRRQLQRDRLTALLADMEAEHGPVDPEMMKEVRRLWPGPDSNSQSD